MMTHDSNLTGMILGVTHGSTKDGPGWRSVVYFKGCNARCPWCSTPESLSFERELLLYPEREKYSERIVASCPAGAVSWRGDKQDADLTHTDTAACTGCESFACVEMCLDGSREVAGRRVSVDDVIKEILPYRGFDRNYGVTLTGGEATCQWEFYVELLKAARAHGLHTAVETNGTNARLPESFPWLDLLICDLKLMDSGRHEEVVGAPVAPVLENIRAAADAGTPLWVRIPLVPGINDGANLDATAEFLAPMRDRLSVEILGYHNLGANRWAALGMDYPCADVPCPSDAEVEAARKVFRGAGVPVIVT